MAKTQSFGFTDIWRSCYLLALIGTSVWAANCDEFEWRCKNGQCISEDEKCDGAVHCADGSDETAEFCYGKVACPKFAFQCAYGACVSDKAKMCNGIRDCADGSDEFPRLCNKTISSGNCPRGHFQCDSKEQCILSEEACDGSKHCKDGSDETEENCAFSLCPPYSFRCRYGACVKGGAKCNGVNDCADGSDEVSCPGSKITTTITNDSTTTSNAVGQALITGCRVSVSSGMIVRPSYDDNDKLSDGDSVENCGGVKYECEPGLYLFHDIMIMTKNFCLNGSWVSPIPECLRVCTRLDAVTFKATYFFNFETLDDNALLRPGTRAFITCAVGYREQLGITAEQKNLKCLRTGEWSPSPWPCSPKCGIIQPNAIVYSTELGSEVTNKNIPWHVGLFKRNADSRWENICGGSIISTKLIITAAHCLSKTVSVVDYMVVAGKYYRDYYKTEPETQDFNVSEIHIPDTYVDLHKQYSNDIGLVILNKHIRYRSHIAPVCYNWEPFDKWELPPGTKGRIVGWGAIKDNVHSDELRSIELPVLSKEECLKKITKTYEHFLNVEKFCVGSPSGGGSLCEGDSGGGFVITKTIENRAVYFLLGIWSVAPDKEQSCHAENYVTFTNIQNHKDFIISYEHKFRPDTT